MSIRIKLITMFLAIALIPIIFTSALMFHNYSDSLERIRLFQLQDIASYKSDKIDSYFAGLKANIKIAQSFYNIKLNLPVMAGLARVPADKQYLSAKKILDEQLRPMQDVLGLYDIMLVNQVGKVVYASNPKHYRFDILKSLPGDNQKAFEEGKKEIFFSDIFKDEAEENKFAMLLTAPAFDFKGKIIGVIVFEIDTTSIYGLINDSTGLGLSGETLLGKKTGNEIVYLNPLKYEPDAALKKRIILGGKFGGPIQEAAQGRQGVGKLIDYRGQRVIAAWRYIPSLDWGMVAKIDVKEAFADITSMKKLMVMVVIIIAILSGILAFSIAQSISGPIDRLTKGAEIVGSGNLSYKVGTNLKDEIGRLSRTFDKMTEDLQNTTASRDELNSEIEVRKQIEEELRRSNENLEQFAYVASHDLQEPLRMMASYSSLLEKRYKSKLDSDADEFIGYIVDGAKRMQRLINDLLAYSRIGRGGKSIADIDLNFILGLVIDSLALTIEENKAVITVDPMPTVPGIESDYIQLFQNLIGNAIKFRGTNIPRVHVSAKKEGGEWLFSVKDNGIGIDPVYKERIFLIFQRLHGRDKYPGTGIGLSICKKIVENRGGRIRVESQQDKGADFCFTIPAKGDI